MQRIKPFIQPFNAFIGGPRNNREWDTGNRSRHVAIRKKQGLIHRAIAGNGSSGILSDQAAEGLRPLTNGEEEEEENEGDGEQYTRFGARGAPMHFQPAASAPLWPPGGVDRSVAEAGKIECGQEEEVIGGSGSADQIVRDMTEQAALTSNLSARVRPSRASFMSPPGSIAFRTLGPQTEGSFLVVDREAADPEDEERQAPF